MQAPFLAMVFLVVANRPLLLHFKVKNQYQTNLFIRVYFSFRFLKIELPQNFFVIFIILSNCFKSCLKPRQQKRYLRRTRIISKRWKWWTSLWKPKLQKQYVEKFLLFFSSFLLCFFQFLYLFKLSLQLLNKPFFYVHSGNGKRQKTVFGKNKNEELFCSLLVVKMPSFHFMQ